MELINATPSESAADRNDNFILGIGLGITAATLRLSDIRADGDIRPGIRQGMGYGQTLSGQAARHNRRSPRQSFHCSHHKIAAINHHFGAGDEG